MECCATQQKSMTIFGSDTLNCSIYSGKTKMYYMLQSDIRGYLPTSLVDSSIPSSMVDLFKQLKAAVDSKLLSSHQ